jgi:hypothetical protein
LATDNNKVSEMAHIDHFALFPGKIVAIVNDIDGISFDLLDPGVVEDNNTNKPKDQSAAISHVPYSDITSFVQVLYINQGYLLFIG